MAIRPKILYLLALVAAAGCSSPQTDLATGSSQMHASSICSPTNAEGEARVGWDGVVNHSDQNITLTSVELDPKHNDGLEVVRSGFIILEGPGPIGGVGAYEGKFDGHGSVTIRPSQTAIIDLVLRIKKPSTATAYGLIVTGRRADGTEVTAHTCWSIRLVPPNVECTTPPAESPEMKYLEAACTRPHPS